MNADLVCRGTKAEKNQEYESSYVLIIPTCTQFCNYNFAVILKSIKSQVPYEEN